MGIHSFVSECALYAEIIKNSSFSAFTYVPRIFGMIPNYK